MIVAIDGFGASGKSVFAARLAQQFHGHVVALDDFSRPGTAAWEHQRVIDEVLTPLHTGRNALYRPWRYDADEPGEPLEVPADALVIVEGVSALALEVVDRIGVWWDLSFWVDTPLDKRRARIRRRDGQALLPLWEQEWWPSEQHYYKTQRPKERADFILRG